MTNQRLLNYWRLLGVKEYLARHTNRATIRIDEMDRYVTDYVARRDQEWHNMRAEFEMRRARELSEGIC